MEGEIRALAERHWNGEADLVHAHHPVTPALDRRAEEIAPGVLTMISIASVNAIDTGDGLAMLDTGGPFDSNHVYDEVRRWRADAPVRAAVYSHHHIDHVFGTRRFDAEASERGWPPPVVYAHDELPDHFRRYERTLGWNTAINQRQFALPIDGFAWPAEYRDPDVTYRDDVTFTQGGLRFELHHARGETDDATWTFVPELGVLHPGDLFIWAVPNAGNPQKVQRFASDWATALREMARCGAELMLCGHGVPIFGADRIRQALTDTAELLDAVETQTLALMNSGVPLDRVLHEVEIPERLLALPYLQPVYDHPQFLVRNVWRRYGGWYDGEPDNLLPPAGRAGRASGSPWPVGSRRSWRAPASWPRRAITAWPAISSSSPSSSNLGQQKHIRCGPRCTTRGAPSRRRPWPATSSATPPTPAGRAAATSPATTAERPRSRAGRRGDQS